MKFNNEAFHMNPLPAEPGDTIHTGAESKETHEFTLEEIRSLLTKIDGQEHLNLAIKERVENIKGELMSITYSTDERVRIDGMEYEISYLLTMAGQRYTKDGKPGRTVSQTFLTKDYDDGMLYSDQWADYTNGEWTNFPDVTTRGEVISVESQKNIEGPLT
jgi:hypothetical protein